MGDFEIIKKIIEMVFEKAEKDSLHTKKHVLAKHISDEIARLYNKVSISEKSIVGYRNKFVEGRNAGRGKPSRENLDLLCNYIGYENYIDFYHKEILPTVEKEEKKEENHSIIYSPLKKKINKKWIVFSLFLLLGGSIYLTNRDSIHSLTQTLGIKTIGKEKECMYWNGEKYIAALCDRSVKNIEVMDTLLLNKFQRITKPDTITERSLGKIWYGRDSNKIEFFTLDGRHPITGKGLKLLTPYMINKYISSKNSL